MTDFTSDGDPFETPIGAASQDYATQTPVPTGEAFGALFSDTSVTQAFTRAAERGAYEGSSAIDRLFYGGGAAMGGVDPTPIKTPMLDAEEANKRYAPEGTRITDKPIPQGIAQLIGKAKKDEVERENVLTRFSNTTSAPVQFGMGTAAFLLDPLNAGSLFLPGLGEEAIAARLGGGAIARTVARLTAGAATGAVSQAPLVAARWGLGQEEASDYNLRDAFKDVAMAAAGTAFLQAGFGAIGDVFRARGRVPLPGVSRETVESTIPQGAAGVTDAEAGVKMDAMRSAIAQTVDGRPVDVRPVFAEAQNAEKRLSPYSAGQMIEDYEAGKLKPSAVDISARYGYSQANAVKLLRDVYQRPDSPIEPYGGNRLDPSTWNWRKIPDDRREANIRKAEAVAWNDFGLSRLDFANDHEFISRLLDEHEERMAIQSEPSVLAEKQQEIYRNGFAAGVPQAEFEATHSEIYGTKPEETEAPKPKEGEPTEIEKQVAEAEAQLRATGALHPDDAAELERTGAAVEASKTQEQAINEAASCLGGVSE